MTLIIFWCGGEVNPMLCVKTLSLVKTSQVDHYSYKLSQPETFSPFFQTSKRESVAIKRPTVSFRHLHTQKDLGSLARM